jgi:peptide/nickel transport system permease protein
MGIYGWERYARIVRGLALSARSHGYAVSMQVLGATPARIYLRHILPNVASAIIVNMTLNFPETILVETSLSFLGMGIQPPLTSLGNMVGFGRDYLLTAWWIVVLPSIVIFVTSLAFSLLGDWLRDELDPTLKGN